MSLETVQNRVEEMVATMFNEPIDAIHLDSSSATIENWDSMGSLMLVLELEQEFGVQFSPEDVEGLSDVRSIVDKLRSKGAQ